MVIYFYGLNTLGKGLQCKIFLTMRLDDKRTKSLQYLLKEQTGNDYSDEQVQQIGLAIMRFVIAKHLQAKRLPKTESKGVMDE